MHISYVTRTRVQVPGAGMCTGVRVIYIDGVYLYLMGNAPRINTHRFTLTKRGRVLNWQICPFWKYLTDQYLPQFNSDLNSVLGNSFLFFVDCGFELNSKSFYFFPSLVIFLISWFLDLISKQIPFLCYFLVEFGIFSYLNAWKARSYSALSWLIKLRERVLFISLLVDCPCVLASSHTCVRAV